MERDNYNCRKNITFIVAEEKKPYDYFIDNLDAHIMNTELDLIMTRLVKEGVIKEITPNENGEYDFKITISNSGTKGAEYVVAEVGDRSLKVTLEFRSN